MSNRKRPLRRLGDLLPGIASQLGLDEELQAARAMSSWGRIVEEQVPLAAGASRLLEVRPPLLDHRVVEFALRLHPDLLRSRNGGPGKLVLRRLMEPRLPAGHLDRPKGGFNLPIRRWVKKRPELLRGALDRLADSRIIRRPRIASFSSEQIWTMLVLDRWITDNGIRC